MSQVPVKIAPLDVRAPWGWRGQRPISVFVGPSAVKALRAERIPGLETPPSGWVSFAWDLAPTMGRVLGLSESVLPRQPSVTTVPTHAFPAEGVEWWRRMRPKARKHHPYGVGFLASRAWGCCYDDMRTGKTWQSHAVSELWDSSRTLYVTKPDLKYSLAAEVYRWTGHPSLVLEGRAGSEGRLFCAPCGGTGVIGENTCTACDGAGDVSVTPRNQGRPAPLVITADALDDILGVSPGDLDDGTPEGAKAAADREWYLSHVGDYCPVNAYFGCRQHAGLGHRRQRKSESGLCVACVQQFTALLKDSRYVIGNYDIFQVHRQKTKLKETVNRADLRGWAPVIEHLYQPTMAWLDESWKIRVYDEKSIGFWRKTDAGFVFAKGHGLARPQQLRQALRHTPRVYVMNGTPTYAYDIDWWQQIDVASDGLFGDTPKNFGARYCGGYHEPIYNAWIDTGTSPAMKTEFLAERAKTFVVRREMHQVTDMPLTQHQVVIVDPAGYTPPPKNKWGVTTAAALDSHLAKLAPHKVDTAVEAILSEVLASGKRTYVVTRHIDLARQVAKAIEVELQAKTNAPRARAVKARVWLVCDSASTPNFEKFRSAAAREFSAHTGGGVYVTTYSASEGGFGLAGAVSCHSLEFAPTAGAAWQSYRRPLEIGSAAQTHGYTVYHYVLKRSLDTDVARLFVPKLEALVRSTTTDAAQLREQLQAASASAAGAMAPEKLANMTDDDLYKIMAQHLAMVGDGEVSNTDDDSGEGAEGAD